MDSPVLTLAVHNGELIAGGTFERAGGTVVQGIARWNGISWTSMDLGMSWWVRALTVYNGVLVAGGDFGYTGRGQPVWGIAQWNGTSWSDLEGGMSGPVFSLAAYKGELIAGGHFEWAGSSGVLVNGIARWDGASWSPLGAGLNSAPFALITYEDTLIAAGRFDLAEGKKVNGVAAWEGGSWFPSSAIPATSAWTTGSLPWRCIGANSCWGEHSGQRAGWILFTGPVGGALVWIRTAMAWVTGAIPARISRPLTEQTRTAMASAMPATTVLPWQTPLRWTVMATGPAMPVSRRRTNRAAPKCRMWAMIPRVPARCRPVAA